NRLALVNAHQEEDGKEDCRESHNASATKQNHRTCNGTGCRSSHPTDKCGYAGSFAILPKQTDGNNGEQVAGQKRSQSSNTGTGKSRHEKANKSHGNHHRPWSNHRNSHRVNKLVIGEPMMLLHHSTIEKGNDGKTASKHKSP